MTIQMKALQLYFPVVTVEFFNNIFFAQFKLKFFAQFNLDFLGMVWDKCISQLLA